MSACDARGTVSVRTAHRIDEVRAEDWNALAGGHPLLRHEFLRALESSGSVGGDSGWEPAHLIASRGGALVGAMPLYVKSHSYGEYVFDWAWAEAYHRHGLHYYPKLLSAIPFSPVSAPKLLAQDASVRGLLLDAARAAARPYSSLHILFPSPDERTLAAEHGMMVRSAVQFHWRNGGYATFDDFLGRFSHDKRKKVKQERRKVAEAGITFQRKTGRAISAADWAFFNRCYRTTYRAHHSTPYLNLEFFQTIGEQLGEHILMVIGERAGRPIAAALDIFDRSTLYGRYWGTMEFHSGLHFEACYYQALEFCIEQGIAVFEGGAQGEHKLARGFEPVAMYSLHWLKHPQFADAVEKFLEREAQGIGRYIDELREHEPYKSVPPVD
jgi:predicted N-acyltransferase